MKIFLWKASIRQTDVQKSNVILTRANFGCGSSREHAPWALEVNDINIVIAESFARIFKQNMFNCGMMAVELPPTDLDRIFKKFKGKETTLETDMDKKTLRFSSGNDQEVLSFAISEFDQALVVAGGWVGYADSRY